MASVTVEAPILDVVGAHEASKILGVELGRISRWLTSGKLPEPYAHPKCSPVWIRADIVAIANGAPPESATPRPPEDLLLAASDVANLLGVNKSQISRWRKDPPRKGPPLPPPVVAVGAAHHIKAGALWSLPDILEFARARRQA